MISVKCGERSYPIFAEFFKNCQFYDIKFKKY